MRLVYTATQQPVRVGDAVTVGGFDLIVGDIPKPHKPDSSGKVYLKTPDGQSGPVYFVSIIGAEWIEREDRDPAIAQAREAAIAAVIENEDYLRTSAEAIVDAHKVIVDGNWFCLDAKGDLYGGPVNADGTLDFCSGGHVDMEAFLGDDGDMVHTAEAMLRAGRSQA